MKNELLSCILQVLLESVDYIPVRNLAQNLKVSNKTVYNYIDSIERNNLFKGCLIEKKQNRGIKLNGSDQAILELKRNLELTKVNSMVPNTDNTLYILIVLFTSKSPYTIKMFSEKLHRSKTSIANELDKICTYLKKNNVNLIRKENLGVTICGNERDVREAFKEICINNIFIEKDSEKIRNIYDTRLTEKIYSRIQNIFIKLDVKSIIRCINLAEDVLNNKFIENDFYTLLIKLCALVSRIKIDKKIINNNDNLKNIKEFLAAEIISINLEKIFNIHISQDEVYEITIYILSSRKQKNINENSDISLKNKLIVEKFIVSLSDFLGIKFIEDNELFESLLLHLKPAIRRMKYGLKADNPLLNRIKYEYTGIYIAVLTSIDELEKECEISFDTNEIGYICLHIVAAVNRIQRGSYLKTCLICDGGITMSKYLESVIQKQIKEIEIVKTITTSSLYEKIFKDFDLILDSRNAITNNRENWIKINEFMESNDINVIKGWIVNRQLNLFNKDKELAFLKKNVFIFKEQVKTRDEILKKYGQYLEDINYVKSGYTKSLIDREEKTSTSVGRAVAVPHGNKELVITQSLIIIKLSSPIVWGDQEVELVMLLSINFNDDQQTKYFFKRLYQIISDEHLLNKLKEVENLNDLEILFVTEA
jgi:transcriptional antiterminator